MKPEVLIVDDSLTVRMDLDGAFRDAGFATTPCGTVAAAREALSRSVASLIVLDVLLPDADGIEFLAEIRAAPVTANIPVILLSTEAEARDRIRGLTTGADEYVGKPYDATQVIARARELVRKRGDSGLATPSSTVLVIDDSATFRGALAGALEGAGHHVVTAVTGEEGLRTMASLRPRAVIVDGILPGIDGATVVRRLRHDAALRRTPCLLLTASEDPGAELRALDAGADDYVRKDGDMGVILARLSAILRAAHGGGGQDSAPSLMGPKRILAIDDSATYLHAIADQLRQEGYEPVLARSGEEALELLAVQPVDCILLDLVMPGLSGHATCRRIKASPGWRDIPVIMLTAHDERGAMIEAINSGADDYIPKSADFEVLKARLRAQLRRKQFEDENRQIREQLMSREVEAAEARAARELAETRARLLAGLEAKNRELEAFAYSVSHDLRAPLRAIGGFSRMLLDRHAEQLDAEANRLLQVVVTNVRQMSQLIDDLLEFSRLGRTALKKSSIDMEELAGQVVQEALTRAPGREADVSIVDLPEAIGDAGLLRQVLCNLVDNALKYSRHRDIARITIRGAVGSTDVEYLVSDNGAGFDMAFVDKLFGVFQRLHSSDEFEGTGVGLAIVRRIIERHSGRVWAEAAPGEGATVHFTLPKGEPPCAD